MWSVDKQMNVCTYDTYNIKFISIKIVMHVVRSWISCRISSIISITILVTTIENLCIYYTISCCIGFITVYTGIRVIALAALSSLAACCHSDTPAASATAGLSISVLHFCVYFEKASHVITSNYVTELMIVMCVYAYMYALYVIPQYHVFIVYINPITTLLTFSQHVLCIWCYYLLLYFVRNDENKDDQPTIIFIGCTFNTDSMCIYTSPCTFLDWLWF